MSACRLLSTKRKKEAGVSRAKTEALIAYARRAAVIPVVTIDDARHGIPLARTLVQAGLPVVEVTLRTPAALDAIAAIAKAVPEAVVGAGTILAASQIAEVVEAGAKFIVSPGTPVRLGEALAEAAIPVLPGCATVSEAMTLSDLGLQILKVFPAVPARPPGAAGRGARRGRVPGAARLRHRLGGDDAVRSRLRDPEVLPGRPVRRHRLAEVGHGSAAAGALLPDRRSRHEERRRVPGACERDLRRRRLDGPPGSDRRRRFRNHRGARPRDGGDPAAGLAVGRTNPRCPR